MSADVSPGALPRCALHPDALAGATCQRCGSFLCTTCTTWVMGRMYCPTCAVRPEVDYLETFRLGLWGRRDAGAWLVGGVTVLLVGLALLALVSGDLGAGLACLASAGVGVAFFLGLRWARLGLLAVPLLAMLLTAPSLGPPALLFFIPLIVAVNIFRDTRNRLFFRLDVPERELHLLWDRRINNPLARHALSLGVFALFMPVFAQMLFILGVLPVLTFGFVGVAVLAVVLGAVALRRVDPQAQPPIGRRWEALGGLCLGLASLALWGLLYGPHALELLSGQVD
ncbi:B-box zinc finger protein [Myxococcus sp. Y35]|uniref:B-box zinc finger protein n=1 Tax=Pseudomyxococcus flavus TaxID=3115648 RepID=UPI003CF1EF75